MTHWKLTLLTLGSGLVLCSACTDSRLAAGSLPLGFSARNRYDRHDQPKGRWRTFYDAANKQPYTVGRYRHGRPVHTFNYYDPTGTLAKSERYGRDGYCDVTDWYPSGKAARRGKAQWVTSGKQARFYWFGPWVSFTEQGDTTALETYLDGKPATRIGFENGKRATLETYDERGRVLSTSKLP
jgi:antitoxin component YwqK of YwqJK toxin-antitoxin module